MPATNPPLQASTIPEFKVDGQVQPNLARDIALLQIEEDVHGLKRLHPSFVAIGPRDQERNEQLNWLDGRVLDFGKSITISMGPVDARETLFDEPLPAPRQCIADLSPEAHVADGYWLLRDQLAVKPGRAFDTRLPLQRTAAGISGR